VCLNVLQDVAEAARLQGEAQAKVEKAMEQVIAANTAREHVKQKVTETETCQNSPIQSVTSRCDAHT